MGNLRIEIKWGVIFTLALLVWTWLEKLFGWHDQLIDKHPIYTMIFILPAFIIYFFAILEKRETDFAGQMTWFQGFRSGLIIGVVVAILSPLAQYITHTFITPDYFANAQAYGLENGYFQTKEEAEAAFNLQTYIVQSVMFAIVMGGLTGAIIALILKKKYV